MDILKRIITNPHPMNIGVRPHTWINASDTSTVTLNGTDVAQINDKSGNEHNFNQTTPANQPDYTGTLNSKKIITFNGTSTQLTSMEASSVWKFLHDGSAWTVCLIANVDSTGGVSQGILYTYDTSLVNIGFGIGSINGGAYIQRPRFEIAKGAGAVFTSVADAGFDNGLPQDQYNIICGTFKYNIPGNDAAWYLNGSLYRTIDSSNVPSSSNPFHTLYIGNTNLGFYLKGVIAEFIIYNSVLTSYQINLLKIYLKAKWGL